jgi:hypothetical protein
VWWEADPSADSTSVERIAVAAAVALGRVDHLVIASYGVRSDRIGAGSALRTAVSPRRLGALVGFAGATQPDMQPSRASDG